MQLEVVTTLNLRSTFSEIFRIVKRLTIRKFQDPRTRLHRSTNREHPILGAWRLDILWCLGVGIWSFRVAFLLLQGLEVRRQNPGNMKLRYKFLAALVPFAVVLSAGAADTFPTLTADGKTYTNVTVTAVTATDIYFTYAGGMGNARLESLSPELQQHFHYNATTAAAQEQQQAQANAGYLAYRALRWERDLPEALARAGSENRRVLMEFASSEWHGRSMKLDQQVFATYQFACYAQSNLVLVRIESSDDERHRDHARWEYDQLASRFNVIDRPTCLLLDSSGKELGRQVGFPDGGPAAFMAWLESFSPVTVQPPATAAITQVALPTTPMRVTPPAATTSVTFLNAVPANARPWFLMAGISAGLGLLTLIIRGMRKRST